MKRDLCNRADTRTIYEFLLLILLVLSLVLILNYHTHAHVDKYGINGVSYIWSSLLSRYYYSPIIIYILIIYSKRVYRSTSNLCFQRIDKKHLGHYQNLLGYKRFRSWISSGMVYLYCAYIITISIHKIVECANLIQDEKYALLKTVDIEQLLLEKNNQYLAEYLTVILIATYISLIVISFTSFIVFFLASDVMLIKRRKHLQLKVENIAKMQNRDQQKLVLEDIGFFLSSMPYYSTFSQPDSHLAYRDNRIVFDQVEIDGLESIYPDITEWVMSNLKDLFILLPVKNIRESIANTKKYFCSPNFKEQCVATPDIQIYVFIYNECYKRHKEDYDELKNICAENDAELVCLSNRSRPYYHNIIKRDYIDIRKCFNSLVVAENITLKFGGYIKTVNSILRKITFNTDKVQVSFILMDVIDYIFRIKLFLIIIRDKEKMNKYIKKDIKNYINIFNIIGQVDSAKDCRVIDLKVKVSSVITDISSYKNTFDMNINDEYLDINELVQLYQYVRNKTRGHGVISQSTSIWLNDYLIRSFFLFYYSFGLRDLCIEIRRENVFVKIEKSYINMDPLIKIDKYGNEILLVEGNKYLDYNNGDYSISSTQ